MEGFSARSTLAVGVSLIVVLGGMLGGMHLILKNGFDGPEDRYMELTDSGVDLKFHFAELNVAYSIQSATHYEVPIANAEPTAFDVEH
ncbi:MAG: hypothetical protein OXQ29_21075 [Rhodospirillaceae bacterium]|nr:hypothetical protein [Rhodospirillaceae bacterium]